MLFRSINVQQRCDLLDKKLKEIEGVNDLESVDPKELFVREGGKQNGGVLLFFHECRELWCKREGFEFALEKKRVVKAAVYETARECPWGSPFVCVILPTKVVNYLDATMMFTIVH